MTTTAIGHQKRQQLTYAVKVREVPDRPPLAFIADQPGLKQNSKVRRHRVLPNVQRLADLPGSHSRITSPDQQPEDFQSGFLAERPESANQ